MKSNIVLKIFLLQLICVTARCQQITWLGVDFSHVKIVGEFNQFMGIGEYSPAEVQEKYFPAWNMLFINESDKYDLKEALRKDNIYKDIDGVMQLNAIVQGDTLSSYNQMNYNGQQLQQFVNQYELTGKQGKGVVLIAENLDKGAKEAWFHLVVLDMGSKQILQHDRFLGTPAGFGIRNYWAGAMMDVLKLIKKKKYKL